MFRGQASRFMDCPKVATEIRRRVDQLGLLDEAWESQDASPEVLLRAAGSALKEVPQWAQQGTGERKTRYDRIRRLLLSEHGPYMPLAYHRATMGRVRGNYRHEVEKLLSDAQALYNRAADDIGEPTLESKDLVYYFIDAFPEEVRTRLYTEVGAAVKSGEPYQWLFDRAPISPEQPADLPLVSTVLPGEESEGEGSARVLRKRKVQRTSAQSQPLVLTAEQLEHRLEANNRRLIAALQAAPALRPGGGRPPSRRNQRQRPWDANRQPVGQHGQPPRKGTCPGCGRFCTDRQRCPAQGKACLKCGGRNHFAAVCNSALQGAQQMHEQQGFH